MRVLAINVSRSLRTATSRRALLAVIQHHEPCWGAAFMSECGGVFSQAPQPHMEGVHIHRHWPGAITTHMVWWVSGRLALCVTHIRWRGRSGMSRHKLPSHEVQPRRLAFIGVHAPREDALWGNP